LDRQVFDEVIVPLLGVKDTAVIGISTPLDENNFYSQMIDLKQEDGVTPLFNVVSISLICDKCLGLDLKGQTTCSHKQVNGIDVNCCRRKINTIIVIHFIG
jgi:hypothetical protein